MQAALKILISYQKHPHPIGTPSLEVYEGLSAEAVRSDLLFKECDFLDSDSERICPHFMNANQEKTL